MQGELSGLAELAKALGPYGAVIVYLLWRDVVQPIRSRRNGKTNSNGKTAYATEADVGRLATSFREYRAKSEENDVEIRERLVRVETLLEADGHHHGRNP